MQLTIESIDGPKELAAAAPLNVELVRQIPGPDRPDYWIAALKTPVRVILNNHDRDITHLTLAARWEGTTIAPGAKHLPVGIAYVLDSSVLSDARLDFAKCLYVAIALASDTTSTASTPLHDILVGTIGRAFGLGKRDD
jgi:hypothetical protein